MNIQRNSLANSNPHFQSAVGHIATNLEKMSELEKKLPLRMEENISSRISGIMNEISGNVEKFKAQSIELENQNKPGTYSEDFKKINSRFTGLTTETNTLKSVSDTVMKAFEKLLTDTTEMNNKITLLEAQVQDANAGFRLQNRKGKKRPLAGSTQTQSSSSEKEEYDQAIIKFNTIASESLNEMEKVVFPHRNRVLTEKVIIHLKNSADSTRAFSRQSSVDTTGIAQTFVVKTLAQASSCSMRHMLKRIYLFKILLDQCAKFSNELKKMGLNHEVKAQKVFTPAQEIPENQLRLYQRAHISMIPQLQLKEGSFLDQREINVKILNSKVDIQSYFSFVKESKVDLDNLLNCVDLAPTYINLIDDMSENFDRDYLFKMLDKIIEGGSVETALQQSIAKIESTLKTLLINLEANDPRAHGYSSNIIPINENRLFLIHTSSPSFVKLAVKGMLEALNHVKKLGILKPLGAK